MLPTLTVRFEFEVLEARVAKLNAAPAWLPEIVATHMVELGGTVVDVMSGIIEPNRYTGALQDSIVAEYDPTTLSVSIHPTAQRGNYDAGALLELGVPHPIPNAPWAPIKAWADFRGLPAFPVWWSIREHGVKAHPFLQRTLDDTGTITAINETAFNIMDEVGLTLDGAR